MYSLWFFITLNIPGQSSLANIQNGSGFLWIMNKKTLKISLPCNCLLQVRYATLCSGNNNTVKYMVTANTLLMNSRLQQSHFHLPKNILYCKLIRYSNWNQNILKSKLFCFPALDYKNVFLFFISLTEQLYKTWLKRKCAFVALRWYRTPVDIHEDKRIQ